MTNQDDQTSRSHTTLDPADWEAFRSRAHTMLDRAIDEMEQATQGRVWTPLPEALKDRLNAPLSEEGLGADTTDEALASLLPYGVGNTHPRFFGWVHGSGTPSGLLAEMVAAAMNANCGGRDHAAIHVERQLVGWVRDLFGFPDTASGLVVSGTSMATIIALKTARDAALAFRSRHEGVEGHRLVAYTSDQAHACVGRAFDMLGLGTDALRKVPAGDDFRMKPDALDAAIQEDMGRGFIPFAVVATAGTVNTGAIEPLADIHEVAKRHDMWMHVDAAFGASGILSEHLRPHLAGIEKANSIAFDFHKWMHVNYDAGFVLIRDGELHHQAFSSRPDYLQRTERGLAAGQPWPVDYGPELSRGFRALKVWAHLLEHGPARLGAAVTQNCEHATYLAQLVDTTEHLERLAPVETCICCFRYKPGENWTQEDLDQLNAEIVISLQESGLAAPSTTRINGQLAIRVNITNHRTRMSDICMLVEEVLRCGCELVEMGQPNE